MELGTSTWLFFAGVAAMAIYFPLFIRTMKTLSLEDQKKYSSGAKSLGSVLGVLPVVAFFFIDNLYVKGMLAFLVLLTLALQTHSHHKHLIERGFSAAFVRQLARVSLVAACGVALMLASAVAQGFTNA